MVMVCADKFPLNSYPHQREPGFYMDNYLKIQIDYLVKNLKNDWAFTIIISGRGEVRVGKSVLAMQIAYYWVYAVNMLYGKNYALKVTGNYVFNGSELIKKGNKIGTEEPFSVIVYDEAGADIQGIKIMSSETKEVMDYLRECGQYNMLTILVLPDYFSLPKGIAITYSTFLIDVTYRPNDEGIFERGFYKFFSRPNKKKLYLWGKKEYNYDVAKPDFEGEFPFVFTVDEQEYRQAKRDALKKREKPLSSKEKVWIMQRNFTWAYMHYNLNMSMREIERIYQGIDDIGVDHSTIEVGIKQSKKIKNFENSENRLSSNGDRYINIINQNNKPVGNYLQGIGENAI